MMHNLVKQIKDTVITPEHIAWIGSADGKLTMSWHEFETWFNNLSYDPKKSGTELACDLVIKMDDGSWYERDLFKNGEWVRRRVPVKQKDSKPFDYVSESDSPVGTFAWDTLQELNDPEFMEV